MATNGPNDIYPIIKFCSACNRWRNTSIRIFVKVEPKTMVDVFFNRLRLNPKDYRVWRRMGSDYDIGSALIGPLTARTRRQRPTTILQIMTGTPWTVVSWVSTPWTWTVISTATAMWNISVRAVPPRAAPPRAALMAIRPSITTTTVIMIIVMDGAGARKTVVIGRREAYRCRVSRRGR